MPRPASTVFPLAPMSTGIRVLTYLLFALPVAFLAGAVTRWPPLLAPCVLVAVLYAVVWLWSRPTAFELSDAGLVTVYPVRRWSIPGADLASARLMEARSFQAEFGFPIRIGVGGLWGGFGWLWTSRRGLVDFAVSRVEGLVIVERRKGRPYLITPEHPARFVEGVRAVASR